MGSRPCQAPGRSPAAAAGSCLQPALLSLAVDPEGRPGCPETARPLRRRDAAADGGAGAGNPALRPVSGPGPVRREPPGSGPPPAPTAALSFLPQGAGPHLRAGRAAAPRGGGHALAETGGAAPGAGGAPGAGAAAGAGGGGGRAARGVARPRLRQGRPAQEEPLSAGRGGAGRAAAVPARPCCATGLRAAAGPRGAAAATGPCASGAMDGEWGGRGAG